MKRLSGLITAFLIVMLCAAGSWAEEGQAEKGAGAQAQKQDPSGLKKDYESYDLGELYVKGEKLPTTVEATDTYEVTAEQIEATHSLTVADALKYVPGLTVTTGRKNSPTVNIHGLNQNKALVLIDGVPYYETTFGSLDLNSIPVDNIAKIEIQKGVSSVLYGPNGLAGVINIITKKPGSRPSLDVRAETGDYQEYRASVSHGMKVGMLNYWFGYDHLQSKGFYLSDDYEPRTTTLNYNPAPPGTRPTYRQEKGVRDNSDQRTDAFWAKVGIEPTPTSEYYLNFHYITRDRGAPASILDGQNRISTTFPAFSQLWRVPAYDNWGADLSGQQKVGDKVTLKGKLFYHDHVDELKSYFFPDYTRLLSTSRYKDYMVGGSLLSDIELAKIDTLRFSFNYRKDNHKERADKSLPFQDESSYTGSFGLENQFDPFKQLSIVGGVSYDWWEVTQAQINNVSGGVFRGQVSGRTPDSDQVDPMLGATYTFGDGTKLYGSWARKIRFPTLTNLYSSNGGNPDLKPEKSMNYILGASRGITKYARAELNLFAYDIDDFIAKDSPSTTAPFRNFGSVLITGFEAIGEVFPMKDLSFRFAYTYNNAKDRSPGSPTERVTFVPVNKVDLSGSYLIPKINVQTDLTALYVGRIWGQLPSVSVPSQAPLRTGDYFIVDARISKVLANHVEVYFAARNIFDKDYEEEIGFPAPGRNLFLGVKYSY